MTKRTLLGSILGAFGTPKSADAQQSPRMVDPRTILFSMPTIANDMAALDAINAPPSTDDLLLHEDEWRQIEFFSPERVIEIRSKLTDLKSFELGHRAASGWTQTYVRDLRSSPVISGPDALQTIGQTFAVVRGPAPIIFHGNNSIHGRVRDGFTFTLGRGAHLYGFSDPDGVAVLGANLYQADDTLLSNAFMALNRAHRLALVDWRSQMLLEAVGTDGNIAAWRP